MATKKTVEQNILTKPVLYEDLPSKSYEKGSKYAEALTPLRKHKNKWYLVAKFEKSTAANGIAGYLRREPSLLPPGKWDFATRKVDDKTTGLFAKFLG